MDTDSKVLDLSCSRSADKLYRNIRISSYAILIASFYFTALIASLVNPDIPFMSHLIRAFFSTRVTLFLFPSLCVLLSVFLFSYIYNAWEAGNREDKLQRGFTHSKTSPYGNAHFEEPYEFKDAAQIRPASACKGKIIGQLTDDGTQCLDFNPYEGRINGHMAILGRSGGGKTFTFVVAFILQAIKGRRSLLISDPKGDLYAQTSGYARDNGCVVRKLDLKNLEKSDGWDCLSALKGKNIITNARIFAQAVVSNISQREDVHSHGGVSLLTALILRILLSDEFPQEAKTMKKVHELLQHPKGISFLDDYMSDENLTDKERVAGAFYMDFKRASGNLAGNIITQLAAGVGQLNNPLISEILSTNEIDLELLGKKPCVYYINFPDMHPETYKFIISLFFTMAFIVLGDYADSRKNMRLPVPVDFLMEEFPSLGEIPEWSVKTSTVRSRGMNIVMIIQDIAQLQALYEQDWRTILGNCGCILTQGINESDVTAEWISHRIGDTSIEVESETTTTFAEIKRDWVRRHSHGVGKRPLLSAAEVCTLSRDGSIILFAEHQVVYATKFPITSHPEYAKLYDTFADEEIDFLDREGRERLHQIEEDYQREFWKTHDIHRDMHLKDISDAILTEPPSSPIDAFGNMVRDDFRRIRSWLSRNVIYKLAGKSPELAKLFLKLKLIPNKKAATEDIEISSEPIYDDESAEPHSFKKFYERELRVRYGIMVGDSAVCADPDDPNESWLVSGMDEIEGDDGFDTAGDEAGEAVTPAEKAQPSKAGEEKPEKETQKETQKETHKETRKETRKETQKETQKNARKEATNTTAETSRESQDDGRAASPVSEEKKSGENAKPQKRKSDDKEPSDYDLLPTKYEEDLVEVKLDKQHIRQANAQYLTKEEEYEKYNNAMSKVSRNRPGKKVIKSAEGSGPAEMSVTQG